MNVVVPIKKNPLLVYFFAIIATIETIWILKSDGFYYIDECAHYMYCRFVLKALSQTVQMWHRPLPQWLFALPAQLGHVPTMFFALFVYLFLLFITWRIAVLHQIDKAEWVILFTGLQPILFDLSYACMTEVPAALMIAISYWFHLKKKYAWALFFGSLVFLCRTEMYLYAGIIFLVYLWQRKWKILPLVFIGPILWICSSAIISGDFLTFFREWSVFSHIKKFIPGVSVTYYFSHLYSIFGIAQLFLFALGAYVLARTKRSAEFGIIYSTILATLILHTITGAEMFHLTASIGELRYIAVVGPLFGIVATFGFSVFLKKNNTPLWQIFISLVVILVVSLQCATVTHPRQWPNYEKVVLRLTDSIKHDYPDKILLTNHCAAAYVMDDIQFNSKKIAPLNGQSLHQYPDCIILWDPFSANSVFFQTTLTQKTLLQDPNITIVDRYVYWNAEYLVLQRRTRPIQQ